MKLFIFLNKISHSVVQQYYWPSTCFWYLIGHIPIDYLH